MKTYKKLHVTVNIISLGILAVYLVYMLSVYRSFPEQIGIHYGYDNEFDVYDSKWLAFFPFIAGFGLVIIFTIGSFAVNKAGHISKKLSDEDDMFVRKTVLFAFDAMKLFWAVFYSIWAHCVIHQTRMFTFGIPIRDFQTLPLMIIIGAFLAVDSKARMKKSNKFTIIAEVIFIAVIVSAKIIINNF